MVFHRLIRECDASLLDELLKLGTAAAAAQGNIGGSPAAPPTSRPSAKNAPRLSLDGWVDTTTVGQSRFDFSSYVRALARFLDEQLEVYERINYLIESDRGEGGNGNASPTSNASAASFGGGGRGSRFRSLNAGDLLFQLPRVQALLLRLADCAPAGAAAADAVVAASLAPVVKESFRGYRAASEGVINLADSLFEMTAQAATQALDCYRAALLLTSKLQAFYRSAEGVVGLRGAVQFPRLEPPPADFVGQIEEYVASASSSSGGNGGGVPAAVAVSAAAPLTATATTASAAAAPAPAFVPLRRGRFVSSAPAATLPPPHLPTTASSSASSALPSPSASAVASPRQQQQQHHDPGMLSASSSTSGAAVPPAAAAAANAAAPAAVDLLGDLLSPNPAAAPTAPASTAAAAAASAPFDPFAAVEAAAPPPQASPSSASAASGSFFAANGNGNGSSSPPCAATAAAAPSFAPGATGLLGSNPFGAAAPAEFTAAPVAVAPVVAVAPAPAAPAAAAPAPSPASASADPFAGLGGLTLGPGPKMTPPLKAMAPERGRPMSSGKGNGSGNGGFDGF